MSGSDNELDDLGVAPLPQMSSEPDSPIKSILKRTPTAPALAPDMELDVDDGPSLLPLSRAEESQISLARERMRLQSLAMESPTEEMLAARKSKTTNNLSDLISMSSPDVGEASGSRIPLNELPQQAEWNKENLPVTGPSTSAAHSSEDGGGTPKSSMYKSKSVGNIMKRPLEPAATSGNVFRIRRRPFGKRSINSDDDNESPKLFKSNDGTAKPAISESILKPGILKPAAIDDVPKPAGDSTPKQPKAGTSKQADKGTPTSSTTNKMASLPVIAQPKFTRSFSETHAAVIKRACNLAQKPNMTADMKQELALPTMKSGKKHQDLHTIDCHILAKLIRGEYKDTISTYRIVDARYVYEFKGGHIVGAENFGAWDEQAFFDEFLPASMGAKSLDGLAHLAVAGSSNKENEDEGGEKSKESATEVEEKRSIVIFHCEFSSQRGPALMKELRKRDRSVNNASYPALHYPEIYLLHNGYKEFFENYPDLCEPKFYQTMKDAAFAEEERMFRKKSKSWAAAGGGGTVARTGASASRLFKF